LPWLRCWTLCVWHVPCRSRRGRLWPSSSSWAPTGRWSPPRWVPGLLPRNWCKAGGGAAVLLLC
jgi:hypothetical protein